MKDSVRFEKSFCHKNIWKTIAVMFLVKSPHTYFFVIVEDEDNVDTVYTTHHEKEALTFAELYVDRYHMEVAINERN